jgi:predicted helicase
LYAIIIKTGLLGLEKGRIRRVESDFEQVLQKYRDISFSDRDKGYRFERLMQAFLKICPLYDSEFRDVWLWSEFPSRKDFVGVVYGI